MALMMLSERILIGFQKEMIKSYHSGTSSSKKKYANVLKRR